jgi:ABC-type sugar transport system ATPase subunit
MITLEHVCVRAGGFALRDISLSVPAGAYAVLMGRTGSGKTTLLEAICGLRPVDSGRILLGEEDVTQLPPAARGVGYVPQDGALFQHLTVRQHLEFALVVRQWQRERIDARVREVSEWLGLNGLLDRVPLGLSGGETQRVALGRALSFQPRILCLDEPLSALDDTSRTEVCAVLDTVRRHTGVTALHITHNLAEAERLGDCVLRLNHGSIESQSLRRTT